MCVVCPCAVCVCVMCLCGVCVSVIWYGSVCASMVWYVNVVHLWYGVFLRVSVYMWHGVYGVSMCCVSLSALCVCVVCV